MWGNDYQSQQMHIMAQQQRAAMQQQRALEREQIKQQKMMQHSMMQQQRAFEKEQVRNQRDYERWYNTSSRYPRLTDKFVRSCLAREISLRYKAMGIQAPEPEVMETKLRFKRVENNEPDLYEYRGMRQRMIKHACPAGLRITPPDTLRVVYISPVAEQFNHDYGVTVPYSYCSKCHTVIYYFNGVDVPNEY